MQQFNPLTPQEAAGLIPDVRPGRQAEEILSVSALSRRIDVHANRISALMREGTIAPDFVGSGTYFFRERRAAKIRELVQQNRLNPRFG